MKNEEKYYLIEHTILPEVFEKVIEVNEMLRKGKIKSISEATDLVGISRSAYYKYKDKIKPFNELLTDSIVTFSCTVVDKHGILSNVLSIFAKNGVNILTINQNLPANREAMIIITARTSGVKITISDFISEVNNIEGVVEFSAITKG